MKLYENVVIGNFLYGLGVAIGGRLQSGCLPGAVNLLQQTPEDKALGDVLLSFPGVLRLIEFKAKGNYSTKEHDRYRKLSIAMQARPGMPAISRRVHWYVETAPSQVSGVEAFIGPYIDALAKERSSRKRSPLDFERFIGSVVDEIFSQQGQKIQGGENDYLKLVRWCQGVGETGAGALIVVVGAGGGIHYVELKDMMELEMPHDQWLEYRHKLKLVPQNDMGMELTGRHKGHDREMGL